MQLDPRTTAVIAVHLQGDIVGPDGAQAEIFREQVVARDVLRVAGEVLQAARTSGALVVYTRVAWAPDYSDLHANSPLLGMVAQAGCLKEGSPQTDIVAEVAPADGDEVVTHQRVGAFAGTRLHDLLQERGITTVVLTGVATNVSVESNARAATDLGYRVVLVEDACSAATPEAHQASVASLGLLAEIATAAEVVSALSAREVAPA